MKNKGQVDPVTGVVILLFLVAWGVHSIAYDSGYDDGFLEANKSYADCLENLDSNLQHYKQLLDDKNKEVNEKENKIDYWFKEYKKCEDKEPKVIIFPTLTFHQITYNIIIISIWFLVTLNLFKGVVKISFGQKIDRLISENQSFVLFLKIMGWLLITLWLIWILSNFINNFL